MSTPALHPLLDAALRRRGVDAALRGRRVCVTGGAGFIGSHLVETLVAVGATVTVIDDLSSGYRSNLDTVTDAVRFVHGSILDESTLDDGLGGLGSAGTVFHLAALGSVPASVERPQHTFSVNADGTLAVLEAARRNGVPKVIYAASSSAYGDGHESPKVESMCPDPLSPYAASKLAGEALLRCHAHCYGLSCLSLRYFNVFGPRQRADSAYAAVVPRFAAALRAGEAPEIYGTGEQTRDFTPVANVVFANLLAAADTQVFRGQVINIAGGSAISLLSLLETMRTLIPNDAPPARHQPPRVGDVMHSLAGVEQARALIGFESLLSVEEGMRLTLA